MSHFVPNFIVGGAPRSGTGWLLACLREHPEVYVPLREVNYFSYEYDRTASWYRRHFEDCSSGQVTGEKSPSYLASPEAAARIHDWNPEVSLIFSLRHPVERAYSAYCMMLQAPHHDVGEDVGHELTPDSAIVREGRYFEHLQRYRSYFPDEQIHVLVFDDLKTDPGQFAQTLFRVIGVDFFFKPSILDQKFGHTKKRGGAVWSTIKKLTGRVASASSTAERVLQWCRQRGYTEWVHRLRPGKNYPPLPDSVRGQLRDYYRDDVSRLRSYLGRELPSWPD